MQSINMKLLNNKEMEKEEYNNKTNNKSKMFQDF